MLFCFESKGDSDPHAIGPNLTFVFFTYSFVLSTSTQLHSQMAMVSGRRAGRPGVVLNIEHN